MKKKPSKTIWTGIGTIIAGIGVILTDKGNIAIGLNMIATGFTAIFARQAIGKIENEIQKQSPENKTNN
jgi:hypothetical protein